jgi:hypothetical protein
VTTGDDTEVPDAPAPADAFVEIDRGAVVWRFERAFLRSNWTCLFGRGCQGILPEPAADLQQGCCSLGAHFGDGQPGRAEAMQISAYAALLDDDRWQYAREGRDGAAGGIFGDEERTHTRVVDGACVFLNRPGFEGGVCWQLPLRVDWREIDDATETATVRRWTRADWGEHGDTMAWCCTERSDGGEAYSGEEPVVDALRDELTAIAGEAVWVELRRRL